MLALTGTGGAIPLDGLLDLDLAEFVKLVKNLVLELDLQAQVLRFLKLVCDFGAALVQLVQDRLALFYVAILVELHLYS